MPSFGQNVLSMYSVSMMLVPRGKMDYHRPYLPKSVGLVGKMSI